MSANMGWECPRCGQCYAPSIAMCVCPVPSKPTPSKGWTLRVSIGQGGIFTNFSFCRGCGCYPCDGSTTGCKGKA